MRSTRVGPAWRSGRGYRWRVLVGGLACLAALAVAGGCGEDDASTSATATTTGSNADARTSEAGADATDGLTTASEVPSSESVPDTPECRAVQAVADANAAFEEAFTDWPSLQAAYADLTDDLVAAIDEVIAATDDEVAADLATLREHSEATVAVAEAAADFEAFLAGTRELPTATDADAAGERLNEVTSERCGIVV